jgi:spore coat protein U-like protein
MRKNIATRLMPVFAVAAVLVAGDGDTPALAATDTATLTPSASVAGVCTIQATTLAFGAYDPTAPGDLDATTTVNLTYTPGTPYDLGLDGGGSGNIAALQMTNGPATLDYSMFAARTVNWDDTVGVDTVSGVCAFLLDVELPDGPMPDLGTFTCRRRLQ